MANGIRDSISTSESTGSLMRSLTISICRNPICRKLVALVMAGGLAASAAAQSGQPLTFVSFGGAYTRSQMLAFVRPFEDKTGERVNVHDYDGGLDDVRRQVSSLNVNWDVIDVESTDAIRGCKEGLFEPVDASKLAPAPDGTPATRDFIPGSLMDCAVGAVVWSNIIAYDHQAYREGPAPATLEDFFDTRKFPGARGMRLTPKVNLEWALMADGVKPADVYNVLGTDKGLARAFRMLDRIKPNIVWWRAGDEAPHLLETGKVVMTTAYNGRIYDAVMDRHETFRIIWDRQVWNMDLLAVIRHSPNRDAAMAFVKFATSTGSQASQATYIPYGPVRRSSQAMVDVNMRSHLPTTQPDFAGALRIDAGWWASHYEEIDRKFEAWRKRPIGVPRRLPH